MFKFSPELERILRESGWTPTREIPILGWVDRLQKEGLSVNALAEKVLSNLGGLTVIPRPTTENVFFPSKIEFDPVKAASSEADRVLDWQDEFGLKLFPVGRYDPLYMILVADDGRVFGAREDVFHFLGDTLEQALELRVFARNPPALFPHPWE